MEPKTSKVGSEEGGIKFSTIGTVGSTTGGLGASTGDTTTGTFLACLFVSLLTAFGILSLGSEDLLDTNTCFCLFLGATDGFGVPDNLALTL